MHRSSLQSRLLQVASLVIPIAFAALALPAHAGQRSFVASYGSDSNPCSLALPCRGFNTAIGATNPGGEVVILDTAGYGPMTINKSIKVIGPSGVYGGISVVGGIGPPPPPTTGVVINAGDTDVVTLRGLDISGVPGAAPLPLYGIDVQNVGTLHIEKSSIGNFTQDTSACIHAVSAKAQKIYVDDSFLRECRNGIFANGTGPDDSTTIAVLVDNTRIELGKNTTGVGTVGIWLQGFSASPIRNSVISLLDVGIQMDNVATNGSTVLLLAQTQVIGGNTGLNVNNTSTGGVPVVTIVGSQFYGLDDGIILSSAGPGAAFSGSLKINDSHFEQMGNSGITASTGADAGLGIELVRSQLTRVGNTAISVAATGTSGIGLHVRESTLSNTSSSLIKTSGTSSITVSLIRSNLHNSLTAVDHGRGHIRMEQTNVSGNVNSLVNNGSGNISSAGDNWIVDNADSTGGTVYITPTIISRK